jgi:vancomycin resistance protein VanW
MDPQSFAPPTLARHDRSRERVLEERLAIARDDPHAHPVFERGKRLNIALAATAFDRLELRDDRVFSFWRTLGPATASRGFVAGMELAGGCVVPAIGGGLCLLSNGLFRLALRANFAIVERHGHSLEAVAPREGALVGADATVAFAHIDLRFRPTQGSYVLRASVVGDALVLALESDRPLPFEVTLDNERVELSRDDQGLVRESIVRKTVRGRGASQSATEVVAHDFKRVLDERELSRSCLTCNETDCHAREERLALVSDRPREGG